MATSAVKTQRLKSAKDRNSKTFPEDGSPKWTGLIEDQIQRAEVLTETIMQSGPTVGKVFADKIERWPIEKLVPYARNPRKHEQEDVARMAGSIQEFGFPIPVLARSTGEVVDGHLRLKGARSAGLKSIPVINCDGWTPSQVKAFRLMANQSVMWAEWDESLLSLEMKDLAEDGYDLQMTGFDEDEYSRYLSMEDLDGEGGSGNGSNGELLARLQITIAEPRTQVETGDVWRLSEHVLICESVIEAWPMWIKFLQDKEGALFCPFPGPFVLLSEKAKTSPLVLVQPDTYIAGHCVDRWVDLRGESEVSKDRIVAAE